LVLVNNGDFFCLRVHPDLGALQIAFADQGKIGLKQFRLVLHIITFLIIISNACEPTLPFFDSKIFLEPLLHVV